MDHESTEVSEEVTTITFESVIAEYLWLDDTSLDAEIRRLELEARSVAARRAGLLALAEARCVHHADGHHSIRGYLRAACNFSNAEVGRHRRLATAVNAMPAVGEALLAGRIGVPQVLEFARAHANHRIRDLLVEVVPVLLQHAEHLCFDDFKLCIDRFIMLADLDGAFDDMAANIEHRTALVTEIGGTLDVTARGGSPLAATTMISISERFVQAEFQRDVETRRAEHGDQADQHPLARTAAQRRFDALEAIFTAAANAAVGDGRIADPVVDIVVDHRTLDEAFTRTGILLPDGNHIGVDELGDTAPLDTLITDLVADPTSLLERRCETSSGTPVHPLLVLQAALTGHVRRVVIDTDGVIVDLGRKQRLFTGSARLAATLLARRCSHPGCTVAATFADVDHLDEWSHGGPTDQHNSGVACGSHNRFKHRQRWRTRRGPNGRHYSIKPDGTIVLPVGERPPDLTQHELAGVTRERLLALAR